MFCWSFSRLLKNLFLSVLLLILYLVKNSIYLRRGIHADVIVYSFAHLHATSLAEENLLLGRYWLQAAKELSETLYIVKAFALWV